ncbi:MFS transporter [Roseococcus pinisoli]|uniref:MFS transporter n=1 Tax=Roseococcus pinisoli TaxID=2835040 RepID=A0ABS5QDQ9_9PROT|nr:MFS transporter [Roseococcus pinisoli]MBS7811508.1 MFS transporter [Roseococcus pinisoli]
MSIPNAQADRHPASSPGMGWGALLSGTNGVRSLALAGGVVLHAINIYIATTILPSVVQDIGGLDLYAWNTTVFVVASILGSALSAKLLQVAGPRGAYATGAVIFALGALICAVSPSMPVMLFGRLIQGLGGGFLFALAYAMIRVVFEPTLWPRAMALVSGMWGVATLVGPAVGGIFAELGIWRAAFWSLAPAALLFALLAAAVLPGRDAEPGRKSSIPFPQILLLVAAVLAISAGSTSPDLLRNVAGIVAAGLLSALLVLVERRAGKKLLPHGSLTPGTSIAALYATMCLLAVTVTSGEIFVPLFLQVLHQQPPLMAGYLAALMAAGWTIGSVTSSGVGGRSVGRMILAAPILQVTGMLVLAILAPRAGSGSWVELAPICVALVAIGLGVGLAWPHLLTGVLKAARPSEQELAGASITTVQLFATAIGAALAGMVVNAGGLIEPGGVAGTANAALWLFGAFALPPAIGLFTARRAARL